jgi:amidase
MADAPFRSALECGDAIARKEVNPVEVLDAYLARVDRLDPELNAFCLRDDERARADARAAADALLAEPDARRSPFFGVPIPIKDLHDAAGWPTTHASFGSSPDPAPADALPVGRLRAAGMVFMGKTTTPELGTIALTESERFGVSRNPWDPSRTPAGSSGGAAAAVAVGMAPIAHGSDGGGSIRSPSSVCNLVGLKPSRHRITSEVEVYHGGATQGVLTRTVADTAAALDVLAVFDPGAWNNAPAPARPFRQEVGADPGRLRVAMCIDNALGLPYDQAVADGVRHTASLLAELGHEVVERTDVWPDPELFLDGFMTVWNTGSADLELTTLEPLNRALREAGEATSSIRYVEAVMTLQRECRKIVGRWGADWDLLLIPTIGIEPPPVGMCWEGYPEDPLAPMALNMPMGLYTAPFNIAGLPAISVPTYVTEGGLPIGSQLVGPPWRDDLLIRVASQLEEVVGWPDRWPPMAAVA